MSKRDDIGFDYNERTNVPTFEEVASVFSRNVNQSGQNKKNKNKKNKKVNHPKNNSNNPTHPKVKRIRKIISYIILGIIVLTILGGLGKVAFDYSDSIKGGFASARDLTVGSFSGTSINYSDRSRFGIDLERAEIDLDKDEEEIRYAMSLKCEEEKVAAVQNIRELTESQCEASVRRLEDQVDDLESDVESWKNSYYDCRDDLKDCEDSC